MNINGKVYPSFNYFFKKEHFKARVNGTYSNSRSIENGIPHGSILSSTLCTSFPVRTYLFADDLTITCKGDNRTTIESHIHHTLTATLYPNGVKKRDSSSPQVNLKQLYLQTNTTLPTQHTNWICWYYKNIRSV